MWLDNASNVDLLFYNPYADMIASIAKDPSLTPLTIGLFGNWGAGKSTLLELIRKNVDKEDEKTVCVCINAWMFEGYEDAKIALMEALLEALTDEEKWYKKCFSGAKELLKRIDGLKIATALAKNLPSAAIALATGQPLLAALGSAKAVGESALSALESSVGEKTESPVRNARQFKNDFEKMLSSADVENVVVLVDDLDRCLPDRIIETMEAMKLFLAVKKTTFVIAADEEAIKYAVNTKYPSETQERSKLSEEYIEKIIQLPIHIPQLSPKDIENYLMLLMLQQYLTANELDQVLESITVKSLLLEEKALSTEDIKELILPLKLQTEVMKEIEESLLLIANVKGIVAASLRGNPRQAKRFLNTFITKSKLSSFYFGKTIDMQVLVKLLALYQISPACFEQLNEWDKNFTTENLEFKEMMSEITSKSSSEDKYRAWRQGNISSWLACEPKDLSKIRLGNYYYLTRDSLQKTTDRQRPLSLLLRNAIDTISNSTQPNIYKNVEALQQLEIADINIAFEIFLPTIKSANFEMYQISELYKKFEQFREDILQALNCWQSAQFGVDQLPYFVAMRKCNEVLFDKYLAKFKIKETLTAKIKAK